MHRNRQVVGIAAALLIVGTPQETPPFPDPGLNQVGLNQELLRSIVGPIAAARMQDDAAYALYLHQRELLIARGSAGRWVAIAEGELLPRKGEAIAPAEELPTLLALVDTLHPAALHRYLFRVGEEGDVAYDYYAPNLPFSDACGMGLFQATFLAEPESELVLAFDRVYAKRGERRHSWAFGEHGIALHLESPGEDPVGGRGLDTLVTPSSACDGSFVLSAESAAKLRLELFEIPGVCRYGKLDGMKECRRAHLRWRVAELELDAVVPVAIWPQRP